MVTTPLQHSINCCVGAGSPRVTARVWSDRHRSRADSGSSLLCHEHWSLQEPLHQHMQLSPAPLGSRLLLLLWSTLQ